MARDVEPQCRGGGGGSHRTFLDLDGGIALRTGVGAGVSDPVGAELEFTTENSIGVTQKVLPTFGVVLATGGEAFGLAGTFDATMAVHGEQGIELAGPLPPEGRVITTSSWRGSMTRAQGRS